MFPQRLAPFAISRLLPAKLPISPYRHFSVRPLHQARMEYVRLGKSGLKISKVIVGCMSYGTPEWQDWVLDEEASLPLLEHAYKAGITTWDTANVYSNGRSEEIVAKAIAKYKIPREELVILSKCFFPCTPEDQKHDFRQPVPNRSGLSRKAIFDAVEASVKRLGTYMDVLQIHRLDKDVDREEIMRALHDVVEKGWVRYIGASSMAAWEFQTLQNIAKVNGWHQFISMQNYYNLTYREEEREMIPYCRDVGVGIIPWSPIARGMLAKPWAATHENPASLRAKTDKVIGWLYNREDEADKKIVATVEAIAKEKGTNMAAIATAWTLSKPGVCPIVGMNSKERIDQAVAASKVTLTEEEIKRLEEHYVPKKIQGHS